MPYSRTKSTSASTQVSTLPTMPYSDEAPVPDVAEGPAEAGDEQVTDRNNLLGGGSFRKKRVVVEVDDSGPHGT